MTKAETAHSTVRRSAGTRPKPVRQPRAILLRESAAIRESGAVVTISPKDLAALAMATQLALVDGADPAALADKLARVAEDFVVSVTGDRLGRSAEFAAWCAELGTRASALADMFAMDDAGADPILNARFILQDLASAADHGIEIDPALGRRLADLLSAARDIGRRAATAAAAFAVAAKGEAAHQPFWDEIGLFVGLRAVFKATFGRDFPVPSGTGAGASARFCAAAIAIISGQLAAAGPAAIILKRLAASPELIRERIRNALDGGSPRKR